MLHFQPMHVASLVTSCCISVVEMNHQPRSNSYMEESVSSPHSNSLPVSGQPDRSGERTSRTLRDVRSSHNATQISTTLSSETSSSSDLLGSSYMLTPEQTAGMNVSLGEMLFTDTALLHSQAPLETTGKGFSGCQKMVQLVCFEAGFFFL